MNGVWMVIWSWEYSDYNAAFSTRDKAIAYIESEATRMGLYKRGFKMIANCNVGDIIYGLYDFLPDPEHYETDLQTVFYQWYPIDA